MNNHADFKRVLQTPGVKLETLSLVNTQAQSAGRLRVGMIRFVSKADTTGVYLKESEGEEGRGSFLGYDKAADWVFTEDTATNIKVGYAYRVILPDKAVA